MILLCFRTTTLAKPYVESDVRQCYNCKSDVWISQSQIMKIPDTTVSRLMCIECAIERYGEEEVVDLSLEMINQLKKGNRNPIYKDWD